MGIEPTYNTMSKKLLIIIISLSLLLTGLSWFFVADETLLGSVAGNTTTRGFPFHFFEITYLESSNTHIQSRIFLPLWFIADALIAGFILFCIWCLVELGLKEKKWFYLIGTVFLGTFCLMVNIGGNNSCVSGFPIEFYIKCTVEDSLSIFFIIYGYTFNFLFWFSAASLVVIFLRWLIIKTSVQQYLMYKDAWKTFLSFWITLLTLSIVASLGSSGASTEWGVVLAFILIPILPRLSVYFKKNNNLGKKFFFSKLGYVVFGIALALVVISTIFNLSYQGGWFDFTDIGFALLAYPLILFTHLTYNDGGLSERLILYSVVFFNLALLIFTIDLFGLFCSKAYVLIRGQRAEP